MEERVKEVYEGNFDDLLAGTDKLVVVEFYMTTCPNCKELEPIYRKVAENLHKDAVFTKVDVNKNTQLALRFGIMGTPTIKFFCSSRPISEMVGMTNATILGNTVKDLIKYKNECVSKSTTIRYDIDGYA
jgi:thioredoxin-like negative regulator of GroEL